MNLGKAWKLMSKMRKNYSMALIGRCLVWILCLMLLIFQPQEFAILSGFNFFRRFSVFHLLWILWVIDMIAQILPLRKQIPLGSQKLFKFRFVSLRGKINRNALREYIRNTNRQAYIIMLIWAMLIVIIGLLHYNNILSDALTMMITVTFYVCDLVCVLIWCPFRLILKNRCCTTCRIFNWDHLMMFTPMVLVKGFYSWSLLALAFAAWCVWEINVLLHPERFWDRSNAALQCGNCTDKLCTQYCQKLRNK